MRVGPSRSELIRAGLAVRVDLVRLFYLPEKHGKTGKNVEKHGKPGENVEKHGKTGENIEKQGKT